MAYLVLMLLFVIGIAQKFRLVPGLRHESLLLTELMHTAVWLLPLPALVVALVSGSDTLRAAAVAFSIVLIPMAACGFLFSLFGFAAVDRKAEITVGHHLFSAYRTNRQGALGDISLEVWRETPVGLGFRIARRLQVGGEGYYAIGLEPIDEQCVTVRFSRTGRREETTREACVD